MMVDMERYLLSSNSCNAHTRETRHIHTPPVSRDLRDKTINFPARGVVHIHGASNTDGCIPSNLQKSIFPCIIVPRPVTVQKANKFR